VTRTSMAVATWAGSLDGADDVVALLALCARVTSTLAAERLLLPNRIVMRDCEGPGNQPLAGDVVLPGAEDLVGAFGNSGLCSASGVEVHGTGVVLDADGKEHDVQDLVVVEGVLTSKLSIWIKTYSDEWMPNTLGGQPQPQRYALNASRLERALQRIVRETGLPLVGTNERIALVRGYRVTNLTHPNGDVLVPDFDEVPLGQ
jgi:hypothetical protein